MFGACKRIIEPKEALNGLIQRQFGTKLENVDVEIRQDQLTFDWAEFKTQNGIALIQSNSIPAAARAIHDLMLHHQAGMLSPYRSRIELPTYWPDMEIQTIKNSTQLRIAGCHDYYKNSTFRWNWDDWEKQIDFMTLQGSNTLILSDGLEFIWAEVWKKYGVKNSFFNGTDPINQPLGIHHDLLTDKAFASYIKLRYDIHKKIVKRCRELGIQVIIPLFTGWIPQELVHRKPEIDAFPAQFTDRPENAYFLHPVDPLYSDIQNTYLQIYTKMVGEPANVYFIPSFPLEWNQATSPILRPYKNISESIKKALQTYHRTTLFIEGSLFSNSPNYWPKDQIQTFLQTLKTLNPILIQFLTNEKPEAIFTSDDYKSCIIYTGIFNGNTDYFQPFVFNVIPTDITPDSISREWHGIGTCLIDIALDNIALNRFHFLQWHDTLPEEKWETYWCNARYGACKTGLLLAIETASQAMTNIYESKSSIVLGNHRFVHQLSPTLNWANYQNKSLNLKLIHLALRLQHSEWENLKDNPLYINDLSALAQFYASSMLNDHLSNGLAAHLLGNHGERDAYFKDAQWLFEALTFLLEYSADPPLLSGRVNSFQKLDLLNIQNHLVLEIQNHTKTYWELGQLDDFYWKRFIWTLVGQILKNNPAWTDRELKDFVHAEWHKWLQKDFTKKPIKKNLRAMRKLKNTIQTLANTGTE
jgi:alpha-N-acetylglucosaminidase